MKLDLYFIKLLFKILLFAFIFILLFGFFRVCEVFYSSYFNQTEYVQIATIGNKEIPTKIELLFLEFRNLITIIISLVSSIIIICGKKLLLKN
jgi:hypothetical protein